MQEKGEEKDDQVSLTIAAPLTYEEENLRKQGWYSKPEWKESPERIEGLLLDELEEIKMYDAKSNTFLVYRLKNNDLFLAARVKSDQEGEKDIVKHLRICKTENGQYQVEGSDYQSDDVVEVVKTFTANHHPPLTPACVISRAFAARMMGDDYLYDNPTLLCMYIVESLWKCCFYSNPRYKWYDPRGKGILTTLGVIILDLLIIPLLPCIICVYYVLLAIGMGRSLRYDDY